MKHCTKEYIINYIKKDKVNQVNSELTLQQR